VGAPELEDLYDEATLAALDRRSRQGAVPASGALRRRAAAGALVTGLALGMQQTFEEAGDDPVVIEVDLSTDDGRDRPVSVVLVPQAPRASRAFVRPWLF
jgi:hypothetical protein